MARPVRSAGNQRVVDIAGIATRLSAIRIIGVACPLVVDPRGPAKQPALLPGPPGGPDESKTAIPSPVVATSAISFGFGPHRYAHR